MRLLKQYVPMACVGDGHIPDEDEPAFGAVRAFLRYLKPDLGLNLGDMWGASSFGKFKNRADPLTRFRSGSELLRARELIRYNIFDASASTEWHVLGSNHEDRLRKDIWALNPELWTIPEIRQSASIPELLGYREAGAHWHEETWWPRPWLCCQHGDAVRKWAGMSVKAEVLERVGTFVIMGHTHRMCVWPVTLATGTLVGCECGCLAKNPPDYKRGKVQDWQQGMVVAWLHKKKARVRFEMCPIEDGVLWWRGMEFSG